MRYVVIGAGLLWGLEVFPEVTDAAFDFPDGMMSLFTGVIIGVAWSGYSAAHPVVFRAARVRWFWLSIPMILLGSLLLSFTHYDLVARMRLCDSELRACAESAYQNPTAPTMSRRVGLFQVRKTTTDEGQVMLHTASGFLTSSGIVYRPDGNPPEYSDPHSSCRFEHLYGPWWQFYEMLD